MIFERGLLDNKIDHILVSLSFKAKYLTKRLGFDCWNLGQTLNSISRRHDRV